MVVKYQTWYWGSQRLACQKIQLEGLSAYTVNDTHTATVCHIFLVFYKQTPQQILCSYLALLYRPKFGGYSQYSPPFEARCESLPLARSPYVAVSWYDL
jgi:hypothetical protein